MKRLFIIGSGGHATAVLEVAKSLACYEIVQLSFTDETDVQIACGNDDGTNNQARDGYYVIAVGDLKLREKISKSVFCRSNKPTSIVSSAAYVAPTAVIGDGSVVMPGAILRSGSVVGKHSIINTSAIVDHETQIGDYVNVSPNATVCGRVHIGEKVFIGTSATMIDGIRIAPGIILGAGAVAVDNLVDSGTYMGIPAKKVKR